MHSAPPVPKAGRRAKAAACGRGRARVGTGRVRAGARGPGRGCGRPRPRRGPAGRVERSPGFRPWAPRTSGVVHRCGLCAGRACGTGTPCGCCGVPPRDCRAAERVTSRPRHRTRRRRPCPPRPGRRPGARRPWTRPPAPPGPGRRRRRRSPAVSAGGRCCGIRSRRRSGSRASAGPRFDADGRAFLAAPPHRLPTGPGPRGATTAFPRARGNPTAPGVCPARTGAVRALPHGPSVPRCRAPGRAGRRQGGVSAGERGFGRVLRRRFEEVSRWRRLPVCRTPSGGAVHVPR